MCSSRLRRSTQVTTESTADVFLAMRNWISIIINPRTYVRTHTHDMNWQGLNEKERSNTYKLELNMSEIQVGRAFVDWLSMTGSAKIF